MSLRTYDQHVDNPCSMYSRIAYGPIILVGSGLAGKGLAEKRSMFESLREYLEHVKKEERLEEITGIVKA